MDIPLLLVALALAFAVAGTVKGAVGIGLPTTALGLTTLLVDPRTAIAYTILPMVLTNAWQSYRQGEVLATLRRYAPFGMTLAIGVALTVAFSRNAPDRLLLGVLGGIILLFVTLQVTRWSPSLPERYDRHGQVGAGAVAGAMGGLVGVWAPPMTIYLAARNTPKEAFVRASGVLILVGSLPLAIGYVWQGHLTGASAWISAALILPTLAGFALGEALRHRLSERAFRHLLLAVFAVMGVNLLRRALLA